MERTELIEKLESLEVYRKHKEFQIIKTYCYSNNKFKIGDFITNKHGEIIQIEKIGYHREYLQDRVFNCKYWGFLRNKDLTIKNKKQNTTWLYQNQGLEMIIPKTKK